MGKQKVVKNTVIRRFNVFRDGGLIAVNMDYDTVQIYVSEMRGCYPEAIFDIVPANKKGEIHD